MENKTKIIKREVKLNIESFENAFNIVQVVNTFAKDCEVDVSDGRYNVNGKSLLGVLSLDLSKDVVIEIRGEYSLVNVTCSVLGDI